MELASAAPPGCAGEEKGSVPVTGTRGEALGSLHFGHRYITATMLDLVEPGSMPRTGSLSRHYTTPRVPTPQKRQVTRELHIQLSRASSLESATSSVVFRLDHRVCTTGGLPSGYLGTCPSGLSGGTRRWYKAINDSIALISRWGCGEVNTHRRQGVSKMTTYTILKPGSAVVQHIWLCTTA